MDCAVLDRTLPSLDENLACDEALLLEAEDGRSGNVLRFWEWPVPAVVLGVSRANREDVNEDACIGSGVAIHRRSTGGGTVLLGKGCLLYSLVLNLDHHPALRQIRPSYRLILDRMVEALAGVATIQQQGISDLAIEGRKISGNAQQRKSQYLLHHGTLLYDFDLPLIGHYLREPPQQPDYREGRDHDSFVTNLSIDSTELKRLIGITWLCTGTQSEVPTNRIQELLPKYRSGEWIRRR